MSAPYQTCRQCGGYFWAEGCAPWTCPHCASECLGNDAPEEPPRPGGLTPPTERLLFRAVVVLTPIMASGAAMTLSPMLKWIWGGGSGLSWQEALSLAMATLTVGSFVASFLWVKDKDCRGVARMATAVVFAPAFFVVHLILALPVVMIVGWIAGWF